MKKLPLNDKLIFGIITNSQNIVMNSTWADNDHHRNTCSQRIEGMSKKQPINRLQVISKINPMSDQNETNYYNVQGHQLEHINYQNVDRMNKLSQGQVLNIDTNYEKEQRQKNLIKLMQEQLQFVKNNYQTKIKDLIKQNTIQLNKLKIKIQDNFEIIQNKDKLIEQLRVTISQSAQTGHSERVAPYPQSPRLLDKINDVEIRLATLTGSQEKLNKKIKDIGMKVQYVEKGLVRIFACKMSKIQQKLNQFIDKTSSKLGNMELQISNNIKKQVPISPPQPPINLQSLVHGMQNIRNEVTTFKQKQFRYQNSNMIDLKRDMSNLKCIAGELQKKLTSLQERRHSIKKHIELQKKQNINASCYFDDYQENYQDADTLGGEDQFFHPLEESVKRFLQKETSEPTHYHSKPTLHNDSFQNFTSDEDDDETPNIKRLMKTLKQRQIKLPLPIEIDLTGYIRKKNDQKYLLDSTKKGFMLTTVELNHCKEKGLIIW